MPKRKDIQQREAAEARQKARRDARVARDAREEKLAAASRPRPRPLDVWKGALRGEPIPREMRVVVPAVEPLDWHRARKVLALLARAEKRARKTVDPNQFRLFWTLAEHEWLRPVEAWKPQGKSPRRKLHSLLDHLLGRYPVPKFLYGVVDERQWTPLRRGVAVFAALSQGGSPRSLVKTGQIPAPLTRRMCALFLEQKAHLDLVSAVRHAQVQGLGGERRLAEAICATPYGRGFDADEPFAHRVLMFFAAQAMLDPRMVGPLLDFIRHRREEDPTFELKGRTVHSLTRDMAAWHGELRALQAVRGKEFVPSGITAGRIEEKRKGATVVWTVSEILFAKDLVAEGRELHHCVYSYAGGVERGQCSIWSLRRNGERAITVEVHNASQRIVQARGSCNRSPTPSEMGIVQKWADQAGLLIRLPGW